MQILFYIEKEYGYSNKAGMVLIADANLKHFGKPQKVFRDFLKPVFRKGESVQSVQLWINVYFWTGAKHKYEAGLFELISTFLTWVVILYLSY